MWSIYRTVSNAAAAETTVRHCVACRCSCQEAGRPHTVGLIYARLGSVYQSAHTTTRRHQLRSVLLRSHAWAQWAAATSRADASRNAFSQLHPHRRCHTAQAHSNAPQSVEHLRCGRPAHSTTFVQRGHTVLTTSRRSGCMQQPPKSAATAMLRVRAKVLCRLEAIWMRAAAWAARYTKHTRKRSSSTSSCSRASTFWPGPGPKPTSQ